MSSLNCIRHDFIESLWKKFPLDIFNFYRSSFVWARAVCFYALFTIVLHCACESCAMCWLMILMQWTRMKSKLAKNFKQKVESLSEMSDSICIERPNDKYIYSAHKLCSFESTDNNRQPTQSQGALMRSMNCETNKMLAVKRGELSSHKSIFINTLLTLINAI